MISFLPLFAPCSYLKLSHTAHATSPQHSSELNSQQFAGVISPCASQIRVNNISPFCKLFLPSAFFFLPFHFLFTSVLPFLIPFILYLPLLLQIYCFISQIPRFEPKLLFPLAGKTSTKHSDQHSVFRAHVNDTALLTHKSGIVDMDPMFAYTPTATVEN